MPPAMLRINRELTVSIFLPNSGHPKRVRICTTTGWDKRLWVVMSSTDCQPINEYAFRQMATFLAGWMQRKPHEIEWFLFSPSEGLFGAEVEKMNLKWSKSDYAYSEACPRRAKSSESAWLKAMGCLRGDTTSTREDVTS